MIRSKKTKPSISDIGETLVLEQEKRLAVRQARNEISKVGRDAALYGTGVLGPDGKHIPIEKVLPTNPPGAQSSPETASLAASYMEHEDPNVRSLAAAVLRLVRAE